LGSDLAESGPTASEAQGWGAAVRSAWIQRIYRVIFLVEIGPKVPGGILISTTPAGALRQPQSLSSASYFAIPPRELPLAVDGVVPDYRHRIAGFGEEELEHHV
jgi:hypothetical protein